MIICHEYQFIFFKTRKTAGTSIEIALSKFCGPKDVITPISPEDEQIRRELGYRGAQNVSFHIKHYKRSDWRKLIFERIPRRFRNHSRAESIKQHIDPEIWNTYTKISVERNPWDKALSFYFWHIHSTQKKTSFMKFLTNNKIKRRTLSNWPIYSIGDEIAADRMMRYENLAEEIVQLQGLLKLPEQLKLPHAKTGLRLDRRHYSEIITPEQRALIAELCAKEIAAFGYRFEVR